MISYDPSYAVGPSCLWFGIVFALNHMDFYGHELFMLDPEARGGFSAPSRRTGFASNGIAHANDLDFGVVNFTHALFPQRPERAAER